MPNVDLTRVPRFYHNYISKVSDRSLVDAFTLHQLALTSLLSDVPEEKWDYRYADGKWSIKELVQHIIDAERIFCYRALTFARKDDRDLPGFDENKYAEYSKAGKRKSIELLEEIITVQKASAALFCSFDDEQLSEQGISNGNVIYVGAIGYIIVGHSLHHKTMLEERYLK